MTFIDAIFEFLDHRRLERISPLILLMIFWAVYVVVLGVYRVYFSPISDFPGPKLAALTTWYQGYYDIWLKGQYIWRIEEMHKQYGPVVRINPHELHFNDPNFINDIFAGTQQRRDKFKWTPRMLTIPQSTVSTLPHDLHRKRRAAMSAYFSKNNVRRLEPIIQETLKQFLSRLEICRKSGEVMPLANALKAATADIITAYSFGQSANYIDREDYNASFFRAIDSLLSFAHLFTHIGWLHYLLESLPRKVAAVFNPGLTSLYIMEDQWESQINDLKSSKSSDVMTNTIFSGMLESDLPESEKSASRLRQEAHLLMLAGTDTTATTLMNLTFHLLSNQHMLARLKSELEIAMPDPDLPPTCAQVESLPYLTAVIQEGIRLHPGAVFRMQRSSPDESIPYIDGSKMWVIPKDTPMSMTAQLLQTNPDIFPDPQEFRPERWLENPRLDKYLIVFSKGTRKCLGIDLAYQELYLMLAGIFRVYNSAESGQKGYTLELYDTIRERDIDMVSDFVVPNARSGTRGVKILAT
ncbi:hypothetical protein EAE96_007363 [Botrytis aclada]|nr:hypothetical protein EAE96_007363 [Botrytis aclada]